MVSESEMLGESCLVAAKMRDEYEKEGGFTSKGWADDSIRYRSDLREPYRRALFLAMQALYEWESNFQDCVYGTPGYSDLRNTILGDVLYYEQDGVLRGEVRRLFDGVLANLERVDELLQERITCNWQVDRLARVERSLMRLGIYELAVAPAEVERKLSKVIKICADLAGEYATDRSMNFVYGVLSEVRKAQKTESAPATEAPSAEAPPAESTPSAGP